MKVICLVNWNGYGVGIFCLVLAVFNDKLLCKRYDLTTNLSK